MAYTTVAQQAQLNRIEASLKELVAALKPVAPAPTPVPTTRLVFPLKFPATWTG